MMLCFPCDKRVSREIKRLTLTKVACPEFFAQLLPNPEGCAGAPGRRRGRRRRRGELADSFVRESGFRVWV
jgi:hypothetical protein